MKSDPNGYRGLMDKAGVGWKNKRIPQYKERKGWPENNFVHEAMVLSHVHSPLQTEVILSVCSPSIQFLFCST